MLMRHTSSNQHQLQTSGIIPLPEWMQDSFGFAFSKTAALLQNESAAFSLARGLSRLMPFPLLVTVNDIMCLINGCYQPTVIKFTFNPLSRRAANKFSAIRILVTVITTVHVHFNSNREPRERRRVYKQQSSVHVVLKKKHGNCLQSDQ
jgi:hypothetical protein